MEVQQAFSDEPLDTCPECQGPLRKVYGNVGIAFKGSGFYKNDARATSSSTSTSSSSSSSGDSSSSSDSGSSSKEKTASSSTASSGD